MKIKEKLLQKSKQSAGYVESSNKSDYENGYIVGCKWSAEEYDKVVENLTKQSDYYKRSYEKLRDDIRFIYNILSQFDN